MSRLPTILIFGSNGMLGSDFLKTQSDKWTIVKPANPDLDIRNQASVIKAISSAKPDFVLNCAAYTRVDDAEDIGSKDNYDINSLAVWHLARACRKNRCGFITISSDYVFDGAKIGGYASDDAPNPINAYGMAKYLGERLALEEYPKTVVVRTSWLYGGDAETKNFVNTMVKLGKRGTEVRVVSDQFGAPTFTFDLCETISRIFSEYMKFSGMVLHFSNTTEEINGISWYEFTKGIFKISDIETKLTPISSEEYPTKAGRPKNSRLVTSESLPQIRWTDSLNKYLRP